MEQLKNQIFISFLLLLFVTKASGSNTPTPKDGQDQKQKNDFCFDQNFDSALGEGQTLPQNVLRVRYVERFLQSKWGYDDNSHKVSWLSASIRARAVALEYGVTPALSMQFVIPFIVHNQVGISAREFEQTQTYQNIYDQKANQLIANSDLKNLCFTPEDCKKLIDNGFTLPFDKTITLPTGEQALVRSDVPIKEYLRSVILNQAAQQPGRTGVGDMEVGALYNLWNQSPFIFSVGSGIRIPTGSFEKVPASQRPTGGGIYEMGLRANFDYHPTDGFLLSIAEQQEWALTSASRYRSSLLSPGTLVEPRSDVPGSQPEVYTHKGPRRKTTVGVASGLGTFHRYLNPVVLRVQEIYQEDRSIHIDGKLAEQPARLISTNYGVTLDGRCCRIPVAFDVDIHQPIWGKNSKTAPESLTLALKLYYLF